MRYPKSFRFMLVAALAGCLAFSITLSATAQQQPPQPPTKPPEQKKSDPPKGDQKKAPQRQGAVVEPPVQDLGGDSTIKIDTQLVELDVTVIDQANRPIFTLSKEDFTVYEDRVKQSIEQVSRAEVPVSFGLVIDTSGSMRTKLQVVSDAALSLIKTMRSQDEAFVAQFKAEADLVQDFTRDKRELEDAIGELFTGGGTSLLDAIIATADHAHQKGKQRRKALVIISDGLEKNSSVKEKEVMEALKEDEVQVYLVGFIDEEDPGGMFRAAPGKKARELLSRLAEDSGGRAFFPKDLSEMPAITEQIAKDLRTQYVVSYYPSNEKRDGTFRTVKVEVAPKDNKTKLIARTRQGYYARPEKGQASAVSEKK